MRKGYLLLEDGTLFPGESLFGSTPAFGEAVFNTSHSGYQEILTDPSYHRQIIIFTCPHIGNVGVNRSDMESDKIHAAGTVLRNLSPHPRNWRSEGNMADWMIKNGIPLLTGVNTRGLALHLRERGAMRAGVFSSITPRDDALKLVLENPSMSGADLVSEVTCKTVQKLDLPVEKDEWVDVNMMGEGLDVAVMDFGVKKNIIRELVFRGCVVTVYPANTPAEKVLENKHNGVLLSNGPGDPAAVDYGIDTVRRFIGKLPIFGICLGHQLLSLAAGLETFKLHFGHRGANHPVRRETDRIIEITSQNHGFAVRPEGMGMDWRITHVNLNDGTVEGLVHKELPIFSIQYHPEASPGPHDSLNYFDRFIQEMRNAQK